MKALKIVGLSLLLLLLLGLLARNHLIKREARRVLTERAGFDLEIGKLKTSLFANRVELEDLTIRNPPDFPESTALVVRRAVIEIDPWALFRGETHLTEMTLDVPRVVVVRNAAGETNLERLGGKPPKRDGARPSAPSGDTDTPAPQTPDMAAPGNVPAPKSRAERPLRIDRLALKVGTVEYRDYQSGSAEPVVTSVELNMDREGRDLRSADEIRTMLIGGVLQSAAMQLFSNGAQQLQSMLEDENFRKEAKKIGKDLKRAFKGLLAPQEPSHEAAP